MQALVDEQPPDEIRRTPALARVREDKVRESGDGFDGTWVAHPDLVPTALEPFDAVLGERPNQVERLREDVSVEASDLLDVAATPGEITPAGLRTNVSVGIRYIAAWLSGVGAAAIDNLMEDAATAEISRGQVWQWVRHGRVSREDVERELAGVGDALTIAATNTHGTTVVSGERGALEALLTRLKQRGVVAVQLPVNYAFHSAQMEPTRRELVQRLAGLAATAARIPFMSTVTADWAGNARLLGPDYWGDNVRQEVRFADAITALGRDGVRCRVEMPLARHG